MLTIKQAKTWYQGNDAVHDFDHIMRVYRLAEKIALKEKADFSIVGAAVLLHDVEETKEGGKSDRKSHHEFAASFADKILTNYKWEKNKIDSVIHCIRAHRFRSTEKPLTIEAKVVFDADKIDAIGAIGAARAIAYASLDNKPILSIPSEKLKKYYEYEGNEIHSSYHEYLFKLKNIKDHLYTETGKIIARNRDMFLEKFYEQLLAEYNGDL